MKKKEININYIFGICSICSAIIGLTFTSLRYFGILELKESLFSSLIYLILLGLFMLSIILSIMCLAFKDKKTKKNKVGKILAIISISMVVIFFIGMLIFIGIAIQKWTV